MKQYEIEEILQHLENAKYIGAIEAIKLINKLNQRRLSLQQRVADLEEVIERKIEKQSHYEAMEHAAGFEAGRQLGMQQERAMWELAASTQEIMNDRK
jgi:hypothetical protein